MRPASMITAGTNIFKAMLTNQTVKMSLTSFITTSQLYGILPMWRNYEGV